jgi:hypothetical protein
MSIASGGKRESAREMPPALRLMPFASSRSSFPPRIRKQGKCERHDAQSPRRAEVAMLTRVPGPFARLLRPLEHLRSAAVASCDPPRSTSSPGLEVLRGGSGEARAEPAGRTGIACEESLEDGRLLSNT